jgi:hypothetical protein
MSAFDMTGTPERPLLRRRIGTAEDLAYVLREAYERTGRPVMLTETSVAGTVAARRRWMDASVAAIAELRATGVPVIGYTWFPAFSLVTWSYRRGRRPVEAYINHMGLWDLRADADGTLLRQPTGLEQRFSGLVAGGASAVGGDSVRDERDSRDGYDREEPAREIA